MTRALIIPDTIESKNRTGLEWLKQELEKRNIETEIPDFPKEYNFQEWDKAFASIAKETDINTIFIAIGGGVPFLLKQIQTRPLPNRAIFLIAGFATKPNNEKYDEQFEETITEPIDFKEIKKKSMRFFIYNSHDDPLVPIEKGHELEKELEAELIELEETGHLDREESKQDFEDILIDIISIEHQ